MGWDVRFNRLSLSTGEIKRYPHDPGNKESFSAVTSIRMIVEKDDPAIMWIATWGGGLEKFDKRTERFTHHQHDPDSPDSISSNTVYDVFQDSKGRIWVCTDNGLDLLDRKTGTFAKLDKMHGFEAKIVHNVLEDNSGLLWFGTNLGLVKFDPDTLSVLKRY